MGLQGTQSGHEKEFMTQMANKDSSSEEESDSVESNEEEGIEQWPSLEEFLVTLLPPCPNGYRISMEKTQNGKKKNSSFDRMGQYLVCQDQGRVRLRGCRGTSVKSCEVTDKTQFWITNVQSPIEGGLRDSLEESASCHPRNHRRHSSTFVKFDNYINFRRTQAAKSILVQVSGAESAQDVQSYLSSEYGPLTALYHYSLPGQAKRIVSSSSSTVAYHWIIAEFSQQSDFEKALESCRYQEGTMPFRSSMCWFSQKLTNKLKTKTKKGVDPTTSNVPSERLACSPRQIDFSKSKSLDDQILLLEQSLKISEVGTRVRFLVSNHLEHSVKSMFPTGCVIPFGSSVNGIGQQTGDLDLVLLSDKTELLKGPISAKNSRLWFQAKTPNSGSTSNTRFHNQRVMEVLADSLTLFVPGFSQVQRILQARVPILRFWSDFGGMQCDLSMTNSSGVHMSELIYMMKCLDYRFPSLVVAIKAWAAARKITNPCPGRQPTNFMFVLLLMYFLQQKKILPTFDILFNNATVSDKRITADGIDCTFMRDLKDLHKFFTPQNQNLTLSELLFGFFEYYSEFDFANKGISLFTSSLWGKPDAGPLYIQNPLERHLNVSRNVSREEVSRLKNECCSTLWKLDAAFTERQPLSITNLLLAPDSKSDGLHRFVMKDLLKD